MFRLLTILLTLALCGAKALYAQTPAPHEAQQPQHAEQSQQPQRAQAPEILPVLCEYRGVKLDMGREQVKAVMGGPAQSEKDRDEFKLGGGDFMTVRYGDMGGVKTIQLYFAEPAHAPKWAEVVGDAEIQEKSTGSKFARAVNKEKNFWVTMFQSKGGAVTTVTLSR
jgi:hypothetical protein